MTNAAVDNDGRELVVLGRRARPLPAPPQVVWASLCRPRDPLARPWLALLPDEVDPTVLESHEPDLVVWSSLWPGRPRDVVRLEVAARGNETLLRFTLLTPDEVPDARKLGHLRRRLNHLLFADLRFSYGQ